MTAAQRYPMRHIGKRANCDVIFAVISRTWCHWWLVKQNMDPLSSVMSVLSAVDHDELRDQHQTRLVDTMVLRLSTYDFVKKYRLFSQAKQEYLAKTGNGLCCF